MTALWAIYRREMLSLWVTPLAWVLLLVFLVLQGLSFYLVVLHVTSIAAAASDVGPLQAYFGQSIFLVISLLLVCPALTMRLLAEERRSGTLETLLTAPVSAASVVLGKYLAVLTTYALMWLPTVLYAVIMRSSGDVEWAVVAVSYLGVIGIGAGYLALGLLASAMTRSQLVALLVTVGIELSLLLLGVGEYVLEPGPLLDVCSYVSVFNQMDEMSRGLIDSRRLVLDGTLVVLPLFVTVRVVDSWRWG